jgi:micrococcal nuclease
MINYYKNWITCLYFAVIIGGLILLGGCQASETPVGLQAQVQRIVSGQTIEVLLATETSTARKQVRLIGISAPDLKQQPWGKIAKQTLETVFSTQKTIILELDEQQNDPFGRQLAYIWQDKKLINEELVAQGSVLVDLSSPPSKYHQRLINAQEYARIMRYGIWNSVQPLRQTPEEFRSQKPI